MELNCIRQLYDYNRWADRRILAMASRLTNEDFIRPMGNSFSSVRDTLSHILGAEWIWLERWQGRSPKALLDAATFPKVQSLESRWETVEHDQTQFIETLTPRLKSWRISTREVSSTRIRFGSRWSTWSTIRVTIGARSLLCCASSGQKQ
jgi:uncharacterized damage-inducible protein DinB